MARIQRMAPQQQSSALPGALGLAGTLVGGAFGGTPGAAVGAQAGQIAGGAVAGAQTTAEPKPIGSEPNALQRRLQAAQSTPLEAENHDAILKGGMAALQQLPEPVRAQFQDPILRAAYLSQKKGQA